MSRGSLPLLQQAAFFRTPIQGVPPIHGICSEHPYRMLAIWS